MLPAPLHVAFATAGAMLVGVAVLAAFWGYGRLLDPGPRDARRLDPGTTACLGLGAYLALCGGLELSQLASRWVLIAFVVVGVLLAAAALARDRPVLPAWNATTRRLLILLLIAQLVFVILIVWWRFDNLDDLQGYLVGPERILQVGSTGRDPFLFRRIEAGLGGSQYLYALVLAFTDFTHLRLADLGVGSVLLGVTVASHAGRSARGLRATPLALAVAMLIVVFAPVANLTPDICGVALLYAALMLALDMVRAGRTDLAAHLRLALLLFALVCLRSTYIVPAVMLFASLQAALLAGGRLVGLRAVLSAAAILLLCAPWMLVCYRIAGTPLYPFLGFGTLTHDEVVGRATRHVFLHSVALVFAYYALAAASVLALARSRDVGLAAMVFVIVMAGSMLAVLSVEQLKFTVYAYRYSFVGLVTVPFFLAVETLHHPLPARPRVLRFAVPALLAVFVLLLVRHPSDALRASTLAGAPQSAFMRALLPVDASDPAQRRALTASLRAMQDAVPAGQRLLVRLDAPFLLDFRRNPIWVMDHPGEIGPPPGMPAETRVAAWRRYLDRIHVPFIAYAYGDQADDSAALGTWFIGTLPGPSHWQSAIEARTGAVQAMLLRLRGRAPVLYDDGARDVIAVGADAGHPR